MSAWVAAARVVALLQIIDGLPARSRYRHALVNDPATATELAKTPEAQDPGEWEPDWEWSEPTVAMLAHLWDTYVAAHTDGKAETFPRPPSLVRDLAREHALAVNGAFLDDLLAGAVTA